MHDTFEIGEVAIIRGLKGGWSRYNGTEVTVLSSLRVIRAIDNYTGRACIITAHEVSDELGFFARYGRKPAIAPAYLQKKKPPREALGRWEDVPYFNPTRVTA